MYDCPFCGSDRVGHVNVDHSNNEPLVHCHCLACDKEWVE